MSKEKPRPITISSKPFFNQQGEKATFSFGADNYKMMLIGIGIITLGMILMIGGGSDDPNKFSEDIFSFQRLTLSPLVIVAGYVVVLLAIIKKPKE